MAGTKPEMAWPHVEQNAVVAEISLPHFEQYTSSPFHAIGQTKRWFRKSYFPLLRRSITTGAGGFHARSVHLPSRFTLLNSYTTLNAHWFNARGRFSCRETAKK
jgi:hypothetical protein